MARDYRVIGHDVLVAQGELPSWVERFDRTPADGRRQLLQHVTPFGTPDLGRWKRG
jgi:hypothetical protein